jgi:molecular chaperone Hsp33
MLVRLTDGWREVLHRRERANDAFPAPVRHLLGEMAAAGTLMQANIKFNGALVLQVFGDGPVKLAVAEVQPDLAFRVTAKVVGRVPEGGRLEAMVNVHGRGRCAITLDPKEKLPGQQAYQGVVPLHGDRREPLQDLSAVLEHYMLQSEQLDTRLVLAANDEVAAGLLIQRLPVEGAGNLAGARNEDEIGLNEGFNRIAHLAATLTREELLTLAPDTVLHRLFWEERLQRFEPLAARPGRTSPAPARASAWARCCAASVARKWTAWSPSRAGWRSPATSAASSTTSMPSTWGSFSPRRTTSRRWRAGCTSVGRSKFVYLSLPVSALLS